MNKSYLIFKHEFLLAIKRASFIILTLSIPVLALLGVGIYKLVVTTSAPPPEEIVVIGYVDEIGIFKEQIEQGFARMIPFASKEDAKQALVKGDITEYFIIPENFTSSVTIQRYTLDKELITPSITVSMIKNFLTVNLLKDKVPPDIVSLIVSPLNLEVTRVTKKGESGHEQSNVSNLLIPGIFSLLLSLALMFGANTLISGLGEEKESRLIEILFSSVSIRQLLVSKVLALGSAGLLQILLWLISIPLLLNLASSTFGGFLSEIEIPANFIVLGIIYFILGYLLFAVLAIGTGAISSNAQEGIQLSMSYIMLEFVPLWFSSLLIHYPDSPVWIVLALFPITSPVQNMLMLGISDIPFWQIITSIGILILSVIVGLFLSIKIFRMYILMYGKRPGLRNIIHNFKSA